MFGSLLIIKEAGKREYSIIEHLGFEIQNQNPQAQSGLLN
jgi:hypothetical protein